MRNTPVTQSALRNRHDSLRLVHVLHLRSSLSGPVQVGHAKVNVVEAGHVVGSRLGERGALAVRVGKVRHHVDRAVVRVCRNVEEPSRIFPVLILFYELRRVGRMFAHYAGCPLSLGHRPRLSLETKHDGAPLLFFDKQLFYNALP